MSPIPSKSEGEESMSAFTKLTAMNQQSTINNQNDDEYESDEDDICLSCGAQKKNVMKEKKRIHKMSKNS